MLDALRTWARAQFPPTVLTLIPVAVGLNLGLGTLVMAVKIPVFL